MSTSHAVIPDNETTAKTTIKVFVPNSSPVIKAFLQVIGFVDKELVVVTNSDEAELYLATDFNDLRPYYSAESKSLFCILITRTNTRIDHSLTNVVVVNALDLYSPAGAPKLAQKLREFRPTSKASRPVVEFVMPTNRPNFNRRYTVVVIDDNDINRTLAERLLDGHTVHTFQTLKEALDSGLMARADFVLTDMDMPPDKTYVALSLDCYVPGETVSYGFAVMIEATKLGRPVAIVTDGNHHQGWVSAMFDNVEEITANGMPVLFFNKIGKRWDLALKQLETAKG